ncbi:MAG: hypothetical protein ACRCW9_05970 [Cetobacterium sp.]
MFKQHTKKLILNNELEEYKYFEPNGKVIKFENKYFLINKNKKIKECDECKKKYECLSSNYIEVYYLDKKNKVKMDECILKHEYDVQELEITKNEILEKKINREKIHDFELFYVLREKESEKLINN